MIIINTTNNRIETNILIRSVITKYINEHNISFKEYAKLVGIPWYVVMALQRGAINITDMKFGHVLRIMDFHNYTMLMRVYQSDGSYNIQSMEPDVTTII